MLQQHVDCLRLLDAGQGIVMLTPVERLHLKSCEECRELLRMFTRQMALLANTLARKHKDAAA